jgi:predicted PurR-regulated permease PerM
MAEKSTLRTGNSVLVSMASFVVIVAGLRAAQDIVVPFLSAAFLTLLSLPLLRWFQNRRLPTWLAMLVERVVAIQTNLNNWLTSHGIESQLFVDLQFFNTNRVVSLFGGMLGTLGSLLNNALIILFLLIFMQLEAADLPAKLHYSPIQLVNQCPSPRRFIWPATQH